MSVFLRKLIGLNPKEIRSSQINCQSSFGEDSSFDNSEQSAWLNQDYNEGQLSVDVYHNPKELTVKSTIAGVKPEDIDISLRNDMLTIRGRRATSEEIDEENYLYKECFWGSFSRSIILPFEVNPKKIKAFLENGILTIQLPKARTTEDISIKVEEID